MIRILQQHGNSHALVFDKTIMKALEIGKDDPLQLTIVGNSLVITPANVGLGQERLSAIIKKLRPRYSKMLKKLAE